MTQKASHASLVKELRERTGIGFMACKKALTENDNDLDAAIQYLRKISGVRADGKAGRQTSEGVIGCALDQNAGRGVLLEVNCETDFVARSDDFLDFVSKLADHILSEEPDDLPYGGEMSNATLEEMRTQMVQKLGENIRIGRWRSLVSGSGCHIGSYLHNNHKIGALVSLVGGTPELGHQIAMHISAEKPRVVAATDLPQEMIRQESEIYRAQAEESGKPANIVDKMVAGKVKRFTAEISLLDQDFVCESSQTVGQVLTDAGASVSGFIRFELGEQGS